MSDMQIIYTQEAQQDVMQIADYHLRMVSPESAEYAVSRLLEHIEKLAEFPRMGEEHPDERLRTAGFRKLVHDSHIVIYRIEHDKTVIIERIVWASSDYPELLMQ
ncbi:MAG: type II toxin-antitoxin system RelE/ParE family toxin [Clostridia bacterium]|jgi:plasmid stabilization system protein ParE|nr:type II toxin-antitoxin system RelE/ParE family toxin [Clostridia bacterium]NLS84084.1 type II toxin-antitoxin system RelE/ParE family toxin [Oscillospiraceae bacterium]